MISKGNVTFPLRKSECAADVAAVFGIPVEPESVLMLDNGYNIEIQYSFDMLEKILSLLSLSSTLDIVNMLDIVYAVYVVIDFQTLRINFIKLAEPKDPLINYKLGQLDLSITMLCKDEINTTTASITLEHDIDRFMEKWPMLRRYDIRGNGSPRYVLVFFVSDICVELFSTLITLGNAGMSSQDDMYSILDTLIPYFAGNLSSVSLLDPFLIYAHMLKLGHEINQDMESRLMFLFYSEIKYDYLIKIAIRLLKALPCFNFLFKNVRYTFLPMQSDIYFRVYSRIVVYKINDDKSVSLVRDVQLNKSQIINFFELVNCCYHSDAINAFRSDKNLESMLEIFVIMDTISTTYKILNADERLGVL